MQRIHLPTSKGSDGVCAFSEYMAAVLSGAFVDILAIVSDLDESSLADARVFARASVHAVHVLTAR